MSEILKIEPHGRVLRLILNRPEKRNALNADLCQELVATMEAADRDPTVGAILLSGLGKSFCSGMDVAEFSEAPPPEVAELHEQLFTIGSRLTKPLIGAVDGSALGGGMGLVANCHIVVSSTHATFGLTEIRLGLWPFLVFRAVAAAVRERRAIELALTGRTIGAKVASEIGLVHEVTQDLEEVAGELAASVAAFSPTAIHSGMSFVHATRERDWQSAGDIGRRMRQEVFESADFREGILAFREKRQPKWPSLG